jgi:hypothetical protein
MSYLLGKKYNKNISLDIFFSRSKTQQNLSLSLWLWTKKTAQVLQGWAMRYVVMNH